MQLFKVMCLLIELGIKLQTLKLVSGDAPPVKGHDKVTIDHLSDFHDLVRKSKHVDKDRSSYGTFAKQTIRY